MRAGSAAITARQAEEPGTNKRCLLVVVSLSMRIVDHSRVAQTSGVWTQSYNPSPLTTPLCARRVGFTNGHDRGFGHEG